MKNEISEIINKFKEILPESNFKIEPESSLNELLQLETKYNMNTNDAIKLYVELDEEVHFSDKYNYLLHWINEFRTYEIFKGDLTLINKIK